MTQLDPNALIWQQPAWPYFQWDSSALLDSLVQVRHHQGRLLALTETGDVFSPGPLNVEWVQGWAGADFRKKDFKEDSILPLFPSKDLNAELKTFLAWWNESPVGLDGIIRAGLAYFWFMTLAPFEVGNDIAGLQLIDLALAQDEKRKIRPYNLKNIFLRDEIALDNIILEAQKKNGDITSWLNWFFKSLFSEIHECLEKQNQITVKSTFLKKMQFTPINNRQRKILSHLLDSKSSSITNRECVILCQTSRESSKRDLQGLVSLELISQDQGKGRSVKYRLRT